MNYIEPGTRVTITRSGDIISRCYTQVRLPKMDHLIFTRKYQQFNVKMYYSDFEPEFEYDKMFVQHIFENDIEINEFMDQILNSGML